MRETQIRVSAGLEDVDDLLGEFKIALEAAEKAVEEEKKNAAS
jgi:cystathionine beta-lyase/cystathionine gamma-synthase